MIAKEWIMRALIASFLLLSLIAQGSSVQAQGPFGRGPGGFRPPMPPMMPPIPMPGVFPGPGYVRVPGVGPVGPAIVATPRPGYGYARSTTVVAVPVLVPSVVPGPYSAARVAVVQPLPTVRSSQYPPTQYSPTQAPQAAATVQSNSAQGSNDLRPGMVLPDGAIVVSVGQPTGGQTAAGGQPGPTLAGQPHAAQSPVAGPQANQPATILSGNAQPSPTPATNDSVAPGTESILENADSKKAEELPPPQPANGDSATNSKSRKF